MNPITVASPRPEDMVVHRDAMLRFARRKIRDADLAEDAVQDALIAAMSAGSSFKGESALRTWLIGILNHKIQDSFRRESRFVRADPAYDDDGEWFEQHTDRLRRDDIAVQEIDEDPLRTVARRRMHAQLECEIDALPATLKDVFTMQALEGVETEEVCRRLQISEANCWVRLHRARKRLTLRLADHLV